MRKGTTDDVSFLASCFVKLSLYLKEAGQSLYVQALPSEVDDNTLALATHFVDSPRAFAFIEIRDSTRIGAILGEIVPSAFPPSGLGNVGYISLCWVEPQHRETGVAYRLVAAAEQWFRDQGIFCVELSYLVDNELAAKSWRKLGYEPFRVFAYKRLEHSIEQERAND